MPTDNADINPYQSPAEPAGQEPSKPELVAAIKRLLRWRLTPVTTSYLFGGTSTFNAIVLALMSALRFSGVIPRGTYGVFELEPIWLLLLAGWAAMIASACFYAATSFRQGRWLRGTAAFVLGLALYLGAIVLGNWLGVL